MGFHVSTLHNLPAGSIQYFVHVLDMSGGVHDRWIKENLHTLAASFGREGGLVTGPRDLSQELYGFLSKNLSSDFGAVEGLLHSVTCLVISEGHLALTQQPVYLIPIATPDESESAYEFISTLINMIADALREGRIEELVSSLGAQRFELKNVGGGFLVCNLRRLNNILELKPNIAGLGVNLNAIIEEFLPPEARSI